MSEQDPKTQRPEGKDARKPDPEDRRARLALAASMSVLLLMFLWQYGTVRTPQIPWFEFKQRVASGQVDELQIGDELVRGRYRHAQPTTPGVALAPRPPRALSTARGPQFDFESRRVKDDSLVPLLEAHQVRYSGMPDDPWLPKVLLLVAMLLLLVTLWRSLARLVQGQNSGILAFGKSRGKVFEESDVKVRFEDVAGADEAREELREVVLFLKSPEKFIAIGARIPKGVLLVGPPGTGKTLLARAVAGEAAVPFYSLSGSEFVEMFVGVGAARVRDLFETAQQNAPCIVFIDELDALGRSRGANVGGTNEEREQTLNQLLVEMDGFETNKGVILLAATNRPEILDPALLRPGRFDRQVLVDRPDRKGREMILRVHARKVKLSTDVDLAELAERTPGFAGADLANIINEAALLAARSDKTEVHKVDLAEAIERVSAGLERRSRIMTDDEKRRVAYHEVGHAVVGELLAGGTRVVKISIVPRGVAALGYTMNQPTDERFLMTQTELTARMAGLLGGRVAERIVFGDVSTGASDDLRRATELARAMVVDYGMSDAIGPISLGAERSGGFLGAGIEGPRTHGAHVADAVDAEVRRLVEAAEAKATELLTARRDDVERIARVLMAQENLEGDELRRLLAATETPTEPVREDQ